VDTYLRMNKPSRTLGPPEGKVKVTVNLEALLVKLAKKAAVDQDKTLGELIEEGLRLVLARRGDKKPPR
jgi:hypothetical protein